MQEKCVKFAAHDCVAELVDPIKGIVTVESERGSITTSYSFFVNLQTALETIPEFKKNFETPDNDDYVYYLECTGASRKFELSMLAVMEGSAVMKSHLKDHLKIFILPYSFDIPLPLVSEIVKNFTAHEACITRKMLIKNVEEHCNYYEEYKKDRHAFKEHRFENYSKVIMGQLSEDDFFEGLLKLIPDSKVVELDSETLEALRDKGLTTSNSVDSLKVLVKNNVYFNPESDGEPVSDMEEETNINSVREPQVKTSSIFKK